MIERKIDKTQVFAVLRFDEDVQELQHAITVKEIVPTQTDAANEVERLNKLNAGKSCRYFWQATRYYATGRKPALEP